MKDKFALAYKMTEEPDYFCRLCLNSCEFLVNIFDPNGNDGLQVWSVIAELLRVDVSEVDGLPPTICNSCMQNLRYFNEFKSKCISSLSTLSRRIKSKPAKSLNSSIHAEIAELEVDNLKFKKCTPMYGRRPSKQIARDAHSPALATSVGDVTCNKMNIFPLASRNEDHSSIWRGEKSSSREKRRLGQGPEFIDLIMEENRNDEYDAGADTTAIDNKGIDVTERKVKPLGNEPISSLKSLEANATEKENGDTPSLPLLEPVEVFVNPSAKCELDLEAENLQADPLAVDCMDAVRLSEVETMRSNRSSSQGKAGKITHAVSKGGKNIYKVILCKVSSEANKPFACPRCPRRCASQEMLTQHMKLHRSSSLMECEFCGMWFNLKSLLRAHARVHSGGRPYECNFCWEKFSTSLSWRAHLSTHRCSKRFKCGVCLKSYTTKRALSEHFAVHWGRRAFECAVCKKKVSTRQNLVQHYKIHTKSLPFKCQVCSKRFEAQKSAESHMMFHRRVYCCKSCGLSFPTGTDYWNHVCLSLEKNSYVCDFCGMRFLRKRGIGHHMICHRVGAMKFSCAICERKFAYKSSLINHSRVHERDDVKPEQRDLPVSLE